MARPTRRSAEVRAREASAEREAARLRASGMALIGKGRGFRLPLLPREESAKAARKFRLPLTPRDPRRPRPTKKWKFRLPLLPRDPPVEKNFISATIADDDEGGWRCWCSAKSGVGDGRNSSTSSLSARRGSGRRGSRLMQRQQPAVAGVQRITKTCLLYTSPSPRDS